MISCYFCVFPCSALPVAPADIYLLHHRSIHSFRFLGIVSLIEPGIKRQEFFFIIIADAQGIRREHEWKLGVLSAVTSLDDPHDQFPILAFQGDRVVNNMQFWRAAADRGM